MHTEKIKQWIERISTPKQELDGFPVCPYARGAKYEVIETDGSDVDPPPWDFELVIYVFPSNYTAKELVDICIEYNKIYPELVFLPDPKDRDTHINGVQTNNAELNLVLCQYRENLNAARQKLINTNYYKHWDANYLEEILGS
jgi:hypothetical protein